MTIAGRKSVRIPSIRQNVSHVVVRTGSKRETALVRKTIAGLLLGSSLLWAGLAWAGIPADNKTEVRGMRTEAVKVNSVLIPESGAPRPLRPNSEPARLYGKLASKVAGSPPDSLVRVIVHLKDQVDLSRW